MLCMTMVEACLPQYYSHLSIKVKSPKSVQYTIKYRKRVPLIRSPIRPPLAGLKGWPLW